ncbi:hypothetical protein P885DRAFT_80772 [Corynascus similis CBS 632.67]
MSTQQKGGPRRRQRVHKPSQPLVVPDIQENAAERKRVLNVLAQRRYRQRKRESRNVAQADDSGQSSTQSKPGFEREPSDLYVDDGIDDSLFRHESSGRVMQGPFSPARSFRERPTPPLHCSTLTSSINSNEIQLISTTSPNGPFNTLDLSDQTTSTDQTIHNLELSGNSEAFGESLNLPNTPSSASFPDSYFLAVPPLTLLRGLFRIATRLNCATSVLSLNSISPFNLGLGPEPSVLPPAWQPTTTQLLVPHHPVIDLLPWPSVRDRMIEVMDIAKESAEGTGDIVMSREPQLVNFVYDIEDIAEGIRIWGSDPYIETNWEIGQVVFERWWFVFDRRTIEQSNYLRMQRGVAPLKSSTM